MVVGGYTLDLYCDTGGDVFGKECPHRNLYREGAQGQYFGPNERDCLRQARCDGWKFKEQNTLAYCPGCSK